MAEYIHIPFEYFRQYCNALDAALFYAVEMKWKIFPCEIVINDKGKEEKPPCPGISWQRSPTIHAGQIGKWWNRWPRALIGHRPSDSGHLVIDIDVKNGGDGEREWKRLGFAGVRTLEATTRTGGSHLWFRRPDDHVGNHKLSPSIDVRCDNGYVILPSTPEAGYQWDGWRRAQPLPRGLADLIRRPANATTGGVGVDADEYDPSLHDWRAVVAKYAPRLKTAHRKMMCDTSLVSHNRSRMIFMICAELYDAGASWDESASVVWRSPYFIDKHGERIDALWRELSRIRQKIN
jgi:hypothetical protein